MDNHFKFWATLWAFVLVIAMLGIPAVLVKSFERDTGRWVAPPPDLHLADIADSHWDIAGLEMAVSVYLTEAKRIETVPLEQYVRGVLAAEMPIEFELEAMKAQAIAARSYIVRRMIEQDNSHVPVSGALVTDGITHQVYYTEDKLREMWDDDVYENHLAKINRAVHETQGLIATYMQRPIDATFFSTSNGYTEHSEDYWVDDIPYLRSVPSPWDATISPRYKETVTLPLHEVISRLGLSMQASEAVPAMIVLERTAGERIKRVIIGERTFTGREVREKLGLNSTDFEMALDGQHILFTTYGYGHGVGMSQWGAEGMARQGMTAEEIIKYYYSGVEIEDIRTSFAHIREKI